MPACAEASAGSGLEVRGMRCERGGRALFDGLDFDVPAAGALTVVGPNGSGKTTLLRALAGLTEASMRRIAWQHEPVAVRSAAWRAQLAYVGHKAGHKEELTAAENLELACALEGGLAMGFAAGGPSPAGKEMVGPQRERMREQRELDATGAEPEREARAAALQARLVWLETLLQVGDEPGAVAGSIATHHSAPPRARLEVYRHGRVIDPSIYLHHASR